MDRKKINKKKVLSYASEVIKTESEQVLRQKKNLDNNFLEAVELLKNLSGKLIVLGVGKSGLVGRKLAATFSSINIPSVYLHPVELVHGDLGVIKSEDIVLILSYSGETEEIKNILPILKNFGVKIISFTGKKNSKLAKFSDVVINTEIIKEACPYNIVPTSSTTAMLAMGDALGITVARLRGFKKEDFAKLHPSGRLGKMLNLRVKDLMRKGRYKSVVTENVKVRDAIIVMTSSRVGATSVVDKRCRLIGYFTDGDLRRKIRVDPEILNKEIKFVMTKNPKYVFETDLVIKAKEMMKQYNCDNLPVVDSNHKVVGILDERDILQEGL
ncbi:MAG: KpsF/GutQ family sugar-phosphate isomerase [Endomicrobiia bacterium]